MLNRLESITYTLFLFLTPLLVTFFSAEFFEFPKVNFLYLITGVMILILIWDFKLNINILEQKTKIKVLLGSIGLIVVSNILSLIFSIDYYTSLFGYYTRFNGGFVSILCLVLWIFFLINKRLSKNNIESSLILILLTGIIISVYAIFQKLGIDKNFWGPAATRRVFSTLGQPNWLSAYLIPVFYLAIYFRHKINLPLAFKFIPSVLVYLAILFTYSISGLFAFGISFLLYLVLNKVNAIFYLKKYWPILAITLIVTSTFAIPFKNRLTEQVSNMTGIIGLLRSDKSQDLEANYGDTGKIRLILWDGTLSLIKSSPKQFLIGSGPETFAYVFPHFRPDSINATSEANLVHNKPHNWYLEIFANLGLVGFTAYSTFILTTIHIFTKSKKTALSKALFCGWISILITNFFGWPTVSLSILFFLIPIFLNYEDLKFSMNLKFEQENKPRSFWKIFPILLIGNFLIFSSTVFVIADYYYKKGDYAKANRLNPIEARYELFDLIYSKDADINKVESFYFKHRDNPYVVKTLVIYLNQLENYSNIKKEIFEDAKKNSPNDLQFKNL